MFSVEIDPNDMAVYHSIPRYLEISVRPSGSNESGYIPVPPRQKISVSPFAIKAIHHSNVIPVGSIMPYYGLASQVPVGWLLCDDRTIDKETNPEHKDLVDHLRMVAGLEYGTTVKLPDLRGMFLRGLNDFGTVAGARDDEWRDSEGDGRTVGSRQDQQVEKHIHRVYPHAGERKSDGDVNIVPGAGASDYETYVKYGQTGNGAVYSADVIGEETRPKNIAVNYIIKY